MSLPKGANRPLAKVCGLARAADVEIALDAGADLVGFVSHAQSPRHVSDQALVTLAGAVREHGARAVLVVVEARRESVDALVEEAGLDAVQLCGAQSPDEWRDAPYAVLRRVGVASEGHLELDAWAGVAEAFVLDHPAAPGGTGRLVDPVLADALARRAPCLLAGGLDGEIIAAGLAAPLDVSTLLGFDASSRLEQGPGLKSSQAVRRYVHAAHAAAQFPTSKER